MIPFSAQNRHLPSLRAWYVGHLLHFGHFMGSSWNTFFDSRFIFVKWISGIIWNQGCWISLQPIIVIYGEPGGGKQRCLSPWLWAVNWQTSLLIRFYSYRWNELIFLIAQTTCAGIRKCASECSLLLVLDDNGSISKVCWVVLFRRSYLPETSGK